MIPLSLTLYFMLIFLFSGLKYFAMYLLYTSIAYLTILLRMTLFVLLLMHTTGTVTLTPNGHEIQMEGET